MGGVGMLACLYRASWCSLPAMVNNTACYYYYKPHTMHSASAAKADGCLCHSVGVCLFCFFHAADNADNATMYNVLFYYGKQKREKQKRKTTKGKKDKGKMQNANGNWQLAVSRQSGKANGKFASCKMAACSMPVPVPVSKLNKGNVY
jgi:hypothetical protein